MNGTIKVGGCQISGNGKPTTLVSCDQNGKIIAKELGSVMTHFKLKQDRFEVRRYIFTNKQACIT